MAVSVLYGVLSSLGVFDSISRTIRDLTTSAGDASAGVTGIFSASRIIGGATLIGAINVFLTTALATLCAFLYNLCAGFVGGIEVTLGERD
ncbi:MAG: hypothetical protein NVSMB13_13440 [Mycobacteriales bacterium]